MSSFNLGSAQIYSEQEAIDRFTSCLNSFVQDDAVGNIYVLGKDINNQLEMKPIIAFKSGDADSDFEMNFSFLTQFDLVLIDSGNTSGDSWFATFHPKQAIFSFIDQAAHLRNNQHFLG